VDGELEMDGKFDPAPYDKYADSLYAAMLDDCRMIMELDEGLRDTFPASDPVSLTQPTTTKKSGRTRNEPRRG